MCPSCVADAARHRWSWRGSPCTSRRPPSRARCRCAARRCAPGSSRRSRPGSSARSAAAMPWCTPKASSRTARSTNVFVERDRAARVEVALAQRAHTRVGRDGMTHTITLYDGERYEGIPGSPQVPHRAILREHHSRAGAGAVGRRDGARGRADAHAAATRRIGSKRAELHWRLAVPVMCVVLALIAVPLAGCGRAQGRYARVGSAVLIYFVYSSSCPPARCGSRAARCRSGSGCGGCTRGRSCWRRCPARAALDRAAALSPRRAEPVAAHEPARPLHRPRGARRRRAVMACCWRWARCSCSSASRTTSASAATRALDAFCSCC